MGALENILNQAVGDGGTSANFDKLPPGNVGADEDETMEPTNPYDAENKAQRDKVSALLDKFLKVNESTRSSFEWSAFRNLCLVGDTKIALLSGEEVTIRELSERIGRGQGKFEWVYGMDTRRGTIVPAIMTDVWSTGQQEVIRITLDDGTDFSCTRNHPVLTWFRGYVPAGELAVGDSLIPMYRGKSRGYECLYQPCDCVWEKTHRRVAEEVYGAIPRGRHVHHKNTIRHDNRPENLEVLSSSEHQKITNAASKEAQVAGVKRSWADPVIRARRIQAIKDNWAAGRYKGAAKKRWANPETAAKQKEGLRKWVDEKRRISEETGIPFQQVRTSKAHGLRSINYNGFKNHKVVRIEEAGVREVFDASVPETQNFALACGVFVHNCLIAGQHDIIKLQGQVKLRNIPKYFPRTQTNKFREKRGDLIAGVAQGRVPIKHLPATDDDEAHATAEIGERVRDVIYTESGLDEKEMEIAGWFIDTGNVFLHPYYDYDEQYGMAESPKQECPQCGAKYGAQDLVDKDVDEQNPMCPECGPETNGMPPSALQPSAETELLPIGALCVDVLSLFEIRGDYRIRDTRKWTWFVKLRRYDVADAKEKFDYAGGEEETGDDGNALSQHYLDVLAALTDQFNPQSGFGNTAQGSTKVPKVTAYELYMLPNEDFPEGLCARRIGKNADNVKNIDPLDTEYGVGIRKGQKFLPLVHGKAVSQSGRLLGGSPLDDAVPLQHFRNRVERAIDMEIRRMANAIWMNPKGSGVDLFNGESGWVCNYNPLTLGGTTIAKPERVIPQLQYLQYLIEMLKQIDDAIERVTGTYFLAGGDAPAGVSAASALSLLDQRAKKAIGPMVREWAKMYLELDKMTLEIARKHWTDERIKVAAGKNKAWEVATFTNADLQGAMTMDIDYQSLFPQSEATERAEIEQLIQGGIIDPSDPEQKLEVLRKFGKMSMLGSVDVHTRRAKIEQSDFLKTGVPPKLLPMIHNSMIHIREHIIFANTDEFMALPDEQKELWAAHLQAHFADEGARRALLTEMQVNPDSPGATDITEAGAETALSGAASKMPGSTAGNQAGSRAPAKKGTTGAGPNQARAADARGQQVMTQPTPTPADLAGAVEPGS